MKPLTQFTIDSGPGTLWKIRVFVWPSLNALRKQRVKGEATKETDCIAFCRTFSFKDAAEKQIAAEMHFHKGELDVDTVVHETAHAIVNYCRIVKLDTNTKAGDEQFAASMEHVVSGTLWSFRKFLKKQSRKKK